MALSVLYGCDDNYAPYTGISMTSLLVNNKDINDLTIYLAAMDVSELNIHKFKIVANRYKRRLVVLDTHEAIIRMNRYNCGTWNGSIATWLRFFILYQIPKDVDRLVWIDSDTIIGKGLNGIEDIDLEDKEVAAVCDCLSYKLRYLLGFKENEPYYNAGLMVFNMKKWRDSNVLNHMMLHLRKNIYKYKTNDQDLLNDYFRGRIVKLPPQYNVQCFLYAYKTKDYFSVYRWSDKAYYTLEDIEKAKNNPVVIHFFRFLGDYPWAGGLNLHPAKQIFLKWKYKSLWNDYPTVKPLNNLLFWVEKALFIILPRSAFLRIFEWFTSLHFTKKTKKGDHVV